MARILVDARISRSWSSGIGVYTTELLGALARAAPQHRYVLLRSSHAPPAPVPEALDVEQHEMRYAIGGVGQHILLPLALRSLAADALVVTHPAAAPVWSSVPRLVIVHDLIPLALPAFYSAAKRLYYRTIVRWSLRHAARVFVDSESTRRDCERLLGLPRERLHVVYPGLNSEYGAGNGSRERVTERPYLLYVGNKRPYKNVDRLLEAFHLLKNDGLTDCDLVIAGRDEPGDIETDGGRLRALADRLSLNRSVRFIGEVPADGLPALYRNAEALVYLSSYEGFGLPPLEAMACGTPVVALNATSLPEVVRKGGVLLESADPTSVAQALRTLLRDASLRETLSRRAILQARRFSWEEAARTFADEIEAMLREQPS